MTPPIKQIILITQDYFPSHDGISTWCRAIGRQLTSEGFKVIVVTQSYDNHTGPLNTPHVEADGIPVIRLDHHHWKSNKYRKLLFAIAPFVSKETLFLCSNWKMGIPCRLLSITKDPNYMVAVHGLDAIVKQKWQAVQQKSVMYGARGVFAVSAYTAGLLNHIDLNRIPFRVIPNGVDATHFFRQPPPDEIFWKYPIRPGPKILSLARIIQRKGFDMTIRALPFMRTPGVNYYIGGKGPYETELKKIVSRLHLNHQVHFLGFIPEEDLRHLYNAMDLYCMPSRDHNSNVEGFGITYLEAGACGLPSIGGRGSGAEDAIIDGETGLLVDPESPEDIARALDAILSDPENRMQMGEKARARIIRDLTWEKIVSTFIEFMNRAIASP